jgi:hypothetical protein
MTTQAAKEESSNTVPEQHQHTPVPQPSRLRKIGNYLKFVFKEFTKGTKLLARNWKQARQIKQKVEEFGEHSLTRAEIRLMEQTQNDLKAFGPFLLLFILLPEAIPPLALLFPKSLPSVYRGIIESEKSRATAHKNSVEALTTMRKELIKLPGLSHTFAVLQSAPNRLIVLSRERRPESIPDLVQTLASAEERSSVWRSHLTVETLSPPLLEAMCRYLRVPTSYRPSWTLRRSLDRALHDLQKDDKLILRNGGIEALSESELEEVLAARRIGISLRLQQGLSESRLNHQDHTGVELQHKKEHLAEWLKLSTVEPPLPGPVLLLLSLKY